MEEEKNDHVPLPTQGTVREMRKLEKMVMKLRKAELEQFTNYLQSPWRILWANFIAGTARGLGFLIGVAIVITVVGFVLSNVLSEIPVVGEFFKAVNTWIQNTVHQGTTPPPR